MKKTKISIIGCGAVADLMYMPAINQLKNIQIKKSEVNESENLDDKQEKVSESN